MHFTAPARGLAARLSALSASTLLLAAPALAAPQVTTPEPGYQAGTSASLSDLCADGPTYASFLDGSYIVFDGQDVEHRSANGVLLRRHASFPFYTFPSFMSLNESATTAYFGESSNGNVFELDLATSQLSPMGQFVFNFDMAIDDAAGFGYISAASGASQAPSPWTPPATSSSAACPTPSRSPQARSASCASSPRTSPPAPSFWKPTPRWKSPTSTASRRWSTTPAPTSSS